MIEMRGRNGICQLSRTRVSKSLAGPDQRYIEFWSKKWGKNPPVYLYGSKEELMYLLLGLVKQLEEV